MKKIVKWINRNSKSVVIISLLLICVSILIAIPKKKEEKEFAEKQLEATIETLEINEGQYNEQRIILKDIAKGQAKKIATDLGVEYRESEEGDFAVLYLNEDKDIKEILQSEEYQKYVDKMMPDYYGTLSAGTMENAECTSFEFVSQTINMGETWEVTKGAGTKVAVIDTGIDTDNKYLASKISDESYDVYSGKKVSDFDVSLIEEGDEKGSHGTMVASVIAADYDATTGIGGIAPETELVVIKIPIDEDGRISTSDVFFGLAYAIECDVDVINMSFNFEKGTEELEKYTKLAVDSDIICVGAAGNDATGIGTWPAADENVIGVGSVYDSTNYAEDNGISVSQQMGMVNPDKQEERYALSKVSNYGENVDIVAYDMLRVTAKDNQLTAFSGTSNSCAMTSGAIALYLSQNKNQEFSIVKEVLYAASTDLGTPGLDWYYGCGLLDVNALVVEEKGTITYDYLTDEIDSEKHVFVRGHVLQDVPEPERTYVVFDGWNYDIQCLEEYDNLTQTLYEDLTVYAAWANEDDTAAYTYFVKDDGTAEITGYLGKRRYVTVPSSIDGYKVTSIGTRAFYGNNRMRKITMPDTLIKIGEYAFSNCSRLLEVEIPGNVSEISKYAFASCARLGTVILSENGSLHTIGQYAFAECGALFRMDLPKNLMNIDATAFYMDSSMVTITVAEGNTSFYSDEEGLYRKGEKQSLVYYVTGRGGSYQVAEDAKKIESYAFAYSRLRTALLPDGLEEIKSEAFVYAKMWEIVIPDGIIEIPENCFYRCDELKKVTLGDAVETINRYAFMDCSKLQFIDLSDEAKVKTIGDMAFAYCINLTKVEFLNNAETIAYGAFYCCRSIEEVLFSKTLTELGAYAFAGCHNLLNVVFEEGTYIDTIGKWAFNDCRNLKSIILPEGLKEIGNSCFCLAGLEKIHIPSTVEEIGEGTFAQCRSMTEITVSEDNQYYKAVENVLYQLTKGIPDILHTFPSGISGDYVVNNVVTKIGNSAFHGTMLTSVTLGDAVLEIGDSAFNYGEIAHITFNDNLKKIGNSAFSQSRLVSVKLNEQLEELGDAAFCCCGELRTVELNEKLTELKNQTFASCYSLEAIEFPYAIESIGYGCFEACTELKEIIITENIISIGINAFNNCHNISNISFDENCKLSRLNMGTFSGCGITSIKIPAAVSSMGQEVFSRCQDLTNVVFEANSQLDALAAWTFEGADSITSLVFEEGAELQHIQARALEQLPKLETVDIVNCNNLHTIDNYAFQYCSALQDIELPESITTIGRYAFAGCEKIQKLVMPSLVDFIGRYAFSSIPDISIYFDAAILPLNLQEFWDYGIKGYYVGIGEVFSNEEWQYTVLNDESVALLKYLGQDTEVIIDTVDGYPVSVIGSNVLTSDSNVTKVQLPETITSINSYAFDGAKALKETNIPSSVMQIGSYAFNGTGITNLSIAENSQLSMIDKYAFADTQSLESIDIPAAVTEIRRYAFANSNLSTVVFAENGSLSTIGQYAFANTKLTGVELPDALEKIDYHAFENSKFLKDVTFGDGNIHVYGYAFYQTGMEEIILPANVEYVGEYCFGYTDSLHTIYVEEENPYYASVDGVLFNKSQTKLIHCPTAKTGTYDIPKTTEVLGFGAFEGSKLSKVNISKNSSLNTIGYKAFYDCANLTSMYIPKQVVSFDYYSFAYCKNLSNLVIEEDSQMNGIYEGAFYGCEMLTEFKVPAKVSEIGEYAFYGCEALATFDLSEANELQGIFAHALQYTAVKELNLPESVIEIGEYAFANNTVLTETTLGENIIEAGKKILNGCTAMTTLQIDCLSINDELTLSDIFGNNEIPESLTTISVNKTSKIPDYCFDGCINIQNIKFSEDILHIGEYAFRDCTQLEMLNHVENIVSLGRGAFYNCANIDMNMDLSNVTSLEYTFAYCKNLSGITGTNNVVTFGWECFRECEKIEEISFENAEVIDQFAFTKSGIKEAIFSEKLRKINNEGNTSYAFHQCEALKKVVIPGNKDGINIEMGWYAFCDSGIEELILGEGITEIPGTTFCDIKVKELKFPDSLKVIRKGAFEYCSDLEIVEFGKGLQVIEEKVFCDCANLNNIILPDNIKEIGASAFSMNTASGADYSDFNHNAIWIPDSVEIIGSNAILQSNVFFESETIPSGAVPNWNGDGTTVNMFMGCDKIREKDGLYYYKNAQEAILVSYQGDSEEIIYESLDGVNITTIVEDCFKGNTIIEKINLGTNITYVGSYAFAGCENLLSVQLGDKIEIVKRYAFNECTSLEGIVLGNCIENIGESAFLYCENMKTVELGGENLQSVGIHAFAYSGITEIALPDSLTKISEWCFTGCKDLIKVKLPEELRTIHGSFMDCSALKEVEWNSKLEVIEASAFHNCNSLETAHIPETVHTIGNGAFANCISLKEVKLPKNLKVLNFNVLNRCTSLEILELPEGLVEIKGSALALLSNLHSLFIPATVIKINPTAFDGDYNLFITFESDVLPEGLTTGWDSEIKGYSLAGQGLVYDEETQFVYAPLDRGAVLYEYRGDATEISITEVDGIPVIELKDNLFKNNENLQEIYIGSNVERIGQGVFTGCANLRVLEFADDCKVDKLNDNMFAGLSNLEKVYLSNEIVEMGDYCFNYCSKINEIHMSENLRKLGENVFDKSINVIEEVDGILYIQNCAIGYSESEQTKYVIREGTTAIAAGAFWGCDNMTEISLPDSVTYINKFTFVYTSIQKLVIPNTVSEVAQYSLCAMEQLESLSVPEIGQNSFTFREMFGYGEYNGWKVPDSLTELIITGDSSQATIENENLQSVSFTGLVETISIDAWNLKEIVFPKNLKTIKRYYVNLEEIELPNTVEIIEESAFSYLTNLKKITLPNGLKKIGRAAFDQCTNLTEMVIPETVTYLGGAVFRDCNNLQKITMPIAKEGWSGNYLQSLFDVINEWIIEEMPVTLKEIVICGETDTIPASAFKYCAYLEKITIPETVKHIEPSAFDQCYSLTDVNIPGEVETIGGCAFRDSKIRNMILPETVKEIGSEAFQYCDKLEVLEIGSNATLGHQIMGFRENNLKTLIVPYVGKSKESYETLKYVYGEMPYLETVIMKDTCKVVKEDAFAGIDDIEIYCYADSAETAGWPDGWNNGNKVYYVDKWSAVKFMTDRNLVHISVQKTGEAIKLPAKALREKASDSVNHYYFVGWDISDDGKMDNLLADNLKNLLTAKAVHAAKAKVDTLNINVDNDIMNQENDAFSVNGQSEFGNVDNTELSFNTDTLEKISGSKVEIQSDCSKVVFDEKATEIIHSNADGEDVIVGITELDPTIVTGLTSEDLLFDFRMTANGNSIGFTNENEENSGRAEISIVCKGKDGQEPQIHYVKEDGTTVLLDSEYNEETNIVTFITEHFSLYSVTNIEKLPEFAVDLELSESELVMYPGENAIISSIVVPENALNKKVTWSSENETVATVDQTGRVTAINVGTTIIKAELSNGVYRTCKVNVKAKDEAETPSVELKFRSASLTLQDNLAINFKAKAELFGEGLYQNTYVVFSFNGEKVTVTDYRIVGTDYVFDFINIAPHQMNDTLSATLYAEYNGIEYVSSTVDYSVAKYAYNMLNKSTSDQTTFRTLLVDLLNYGAQAQQYMTYNTESLVNASLTEEQAAWGTAESRTYESLQEVAYETIDNPTVAWKSAGLNLKDRVEIRVKIAADSSENLSLKARLDDGSEWIIPAEKFEETTGGYYIYFNGLNAGQMSEAVYFTIYNGDTAVSNTLRYSVESYAANKMSGNDEALKDILKAMMKYGDAAKDYVN